MRIGVGWSGVGWVRRIGKWGEELEGTGKNKRVSIKSIEYRGGGGAYRGTHTQTLFSAPLQPPPSLSLTHACKCMDTVVHTESHSNVQNDPLTPPSNATPSHTHVHTSMAARSALEKLALNTTCAELWDMR